MGDGLYLLELVSHDGEPLGELRPRGRSITLGRRARASCSFTLDIDELAETPLGEQLRAGLVDVQVTYAGLILMRGPVAGARVSLEATSGSVTFAGVGIREMLAGRYLPAGYAIEATEQAQAVWELIEHANQLEDLGIVAGSLPDSVARTKVWDARVSVLAAIEELANLEDGFDWSLVPLADGHRLDVHPDEQAEASDLVLDYGRTVAGVGDDITAGPTELVNEVIVAGAGGVEVIEDDPTSVTLHRLRQRFIQLPDADEATALGDAARGELARDARPRNAPRLRLAPGHPEITLDRILPGREVAVEVRRGWYELVAPMVIDEVTVALSEEQGERIDVVVQPPRVSP